MVSLDSNIGVMKWGSTLLPVVTPTSEYEAAIIIAGCVIHILMKYLDVYGELRSTGHAVPLLNGMARSNCHAVPLSNGITKAACSTAASCYYNCERLKCKANASEIEVSD